MIHSKVKIIVVLAILIILSGAYFAYPQISQFVDAKPYQTIPPEESGTGATISLYKDIPPGFPKEILEKSITLESSNTVVDSSGKTHITISYISDFSVSEASTIYLESLSKNNWTEVHPVPLPNLTTISAKRGSETLIITLTRARFSDSKITFQYEK